MTAQPRLIALSSTAMGSGKSEVARHLVERHGFMHVKFASFLKAMMRALLHEIGYDPDTIERYVEGDLKETVIPELGVTSRYAQQALGTEWGRICIREDLWAHLTQTKALRHLNAGRSVVIDDMRYPNELDKVEEIGGTPVRVRRPGVADATGHSSEGALNNYPMAEIDNSGTIADLRAATDITLSLS